MPRFQSDPALLGTAREGIGLVFEDDRLVAADRSGLGLLDINWSALGARGIGELFGEESRMNGGRAGRLIDAAGRELFRKRRWIDGHHHRSAARNAHPRRDEGALSSRRLDDPTHVAMLRAVRLLEANVPKLIRGET